MATAPGLSVVESVGARFVTAVSNQDCTQVEACFDGRVRFQALIPSGLREAEDSASAAGYIGRWFGDADELVLLTSDVAQIGDRLGISYRFRVHEDQWYVVEQQAYCEVSDGRIQHMRLLCSGFRPESTPVDE